MRSIVNTGSMGCSVCFCTARLCASRLLLSFCVVIDCRCDICSMLGCKAALPHTSPPFKSPAAHGCTSLRQVGELEGTAGDEQGVKERRPPEQEGSLLLVITASL